LDDRVERCRYRSAATEVPIFGNVNMRADLFEFDATPTAEAREWLVVPGGG
jgi:hypothetical protein